jgi:hypothetical protein
VPQWALGVSIFTSDALHLAMPTAPPWVSLFKLYTWGFKLYSWGMFVLALIIAAGAVLIATLSAPRDHPTASTPQGSRSPVRAS